MQRLVYAQRIQEKGSINWDYIAVFKSTIDVQSARDMVQEFMNLCNMANVIKEATTTKSINLPNKSTLQSKKDLPYVTFRKSMTALRILKRLTLTTGVETVNILL